MEKHHCTTLGCRFILSPQDGALVTNTHIGDQMAYTLAIPKPNQQGVIMDPKFLDDLAKKLADSVPGGLKDLQQDLEKNFHAILQNTFAKMNLVTREEFETQAALLARTRTKLDDMAKQVAALEQQKEEKTPG